MRLHKKYGVSSHLTVCPMCGGESQELLLLGAHNQVFRCQHCKQVHIGRPRHGRCQKCGSNVTLERELDPLERLLASEPCDSCKKNLAEQKEEVKKGGVYFRCTDCGSAGVIKHEHPYAMAVRLAHNLAAPHPCGVEFTKGECPACREQSKAG